MNFRWGLPVRLVLLLSSPLIGSLAAVQSASADEGQTLYSKKVAPLLQKRCFRCHSADADDIKGGLRVDSREGLLAGGDSGPAVVPGDLQQSLILSALRYDDDFYQMPPDSKLPAEDIANIRRWIQLGAGVAKQPRRP